MIGPHRRQFAGEQSLFETHLDECMSCRDRLETSAAEQKYWSEAAIYLRDDALDGELATIFRERHVDRPVFLDAQCDGGLGLAAVPRRAQFGEASLAELLLLVVARVRHRDGGVEPDPVVRAGCLAGADAPRGSPMAGKQGGNIALTYIQKYLSAYLAEHLKQQLAKRKKGFPPEILSYHIASSFISLLTWWLDSDSTYSTEQMNDFYRRLVEPGVNLIMLAG